MIVPKKRSLNISIEFIVYEIDLEDVSMLSKSTFFCYFVIWPQNKMHPKIVLAIIKAVIKNKLK